MKRIKISIFTAISIAIVLCLNGFADVRKNNRLLSSYSYWYETIDGVHISSIQYSNAAVPLAQDQLVPNGVHVPCDFSGNLLCMRGSNIARTIGQPLPPAGVDSDIYREN